MYYVSVHGVDEHVINAYYYHLSSYPQAFYIGVFSSAAQLCQLNQSVIPRLLPLHVLY